jgi:hypothetical protein
MAQDANQWEWMEPEPREWLPCVTLTDPVSVSFYTYTGLGSQKIVRHLDTYHRGKYEFELADSVIAESDGGFCF